MKDIFLHKSLMKMQSVSKELFNFVHKDNITFNIF